MTQLCKKLLAWQQGGCPGPSENLRELTDLRQSNILLNHLNNMNLKQSTPHFSGREKEMVKAA